MYRVLASLRQDMNEGWVWIKNAGLEPRSIVEIKNMKNRKKIYCECLEIEKKFLKEYNQSPRTTISDKDNNVIIMNSWYRKRLGGLKTKQEHELVIREANHFGGKLMSNWGHPQVVVRLATKLAILSVILGIISISISIATLD